MVLTMDKKDPISLIHDDQRPGETSVPLSGPADDGIYFIGGIHTPWTKRGECPRRGDLEGPICRIELFEAWRQGLSPWVPLALPAWPGAVEQRALQSR
jgi:hypothetical protein